MPLDVRFKQLMDDIVLMTYNPHFVDENYKSKFDTKNEVGYREDLFYIFRTDIFVVLVSH